LGEQKSLPAEYSQELTAFRAEALAVLAGLTGGCSPTSSHPHHETESRIRHFLRLHCNCGERHQALAFAKKRGPARTIHAGWRKLIDSADSLAIRMQRKRRQPPDPARPAGLQPATPDRRKLGGEKVTEQSQNFKDGSHYIE